MELFHCMMSTNVIHTVKSKQKLSALIHKNNSVFPINLKQYIAITGLKQYDLRVQPFALIQK